MAEPVDSVTALEGTRLVIRFLQIRLAILGSVLGIVLGSLTQSFCFCCCYGGYVKVSMYRVMLERYCCRRAYVAESQTLTRLLECISI